MSPATADLEPAAPARPDTALRERVLLAAHDLRSPLNAILTWAEVLEQNLPGEPAPAVARALAGIRDGVARQVAQIERLLELTRPAPDPGFGRAP